MSTIAPITAVSATAVSNKYLQGRLLPYFMLRGEVQSTSTLNDWAGYINRINRQDLTRLITVITSGVYT